MAKCIKCGEGTGLFGKHYTRAENGPFCKECIRPHRALEMLYLEQSRQAAEGKAHAAAWVAVCHLTCAERVNLIRDSKHASGVALASDATWQASKAKALEYVKIATEFLYKDVAGQAVLDAIRQRAMAVDGPHGAEIHAQEGSPSAAPVFPHFTHSLEDWALFSGEISIGDVEKVIPTLTGHEWLGQEAIDHAKQQAKTR